MLSRETAFRTVRPVLWFALGFVLLALAHLPLLKLPYCWDEAGYYVPAARDLLSGSLIPTSVPSNAHPPLVMAYLALIWKIAGYKVIVTRTAMLALATFALAAVFRLAEKVANREAAAAATICTALYPVFFAQSTMAHVDLAAAGLSLWALCAYLDERRWPAAVWFSLAALAKETAVLIPLTLLGWELLGRLPALDGSRFFRKPRRFPQGLLVPFFGLAFWYGFHYRKTGFVWGNPEFFRYNVAATLQPLRIVLALGLRLRQLLLYMNLGLLTAAALLAMWLPPLRDDSKERPGIELSTRFEFYAVMAVYTVAMAFVGGAVLARYMLPVVPLLIILCVSTLWRRVRVWLGVLALIVASFAAGLFINPSYGFSFEDNLAYRDYVVLHQRAEEFVEGRYPQARVLTAWPASDELSRPYLGYVSRPVRVLRIEDFTLEQLMAAAEMRSQFDAALVFSTKYDPPPRWYQRWRKWQEWKTRFFGYHHDQPPAVAAQVLGGRIVYSDARDGQWVAVIEMTEIREATLPSHGTRAISQPAIKWQEWVLMMSQTSRPGCKRRSSRAARVSFTSMGTPQSTTAVTMMSRCSSDTTRPGMMLRALRPAGWTDAKRISPAPMATRSIAPVSARTKGVSSSSLLSAIRQLMVPRSG